MKKKILIAIIFVFGCIIGCSNDSDDAPTTQNVNKSANLQATGSSANDFLSNTNFDRLLVEIAYVEGFQPSGQTVANFEDYLRERTFKQNIEFSFKSLSSPNEETLVLEEISELENENRTAYNDGTTLAVYIYFADAPSDGDDESEGLVTLGAVYRNTSMVIYESTIRDLANRATTITLTDVETATLNHEFGHLFGLVNLGTTPVNNHEDAEAENHCNVNGCLMRAELQFGGPMMKMLESNASKGSAAVPVLDAECILDLQGNGGR
ncbi:hypothetical protein DKG77_07290 [Flagellimonas aquimarina]|uniref:Membrane metalloprotease n=1 Tax=Flagellimonas aquimarina TaxID=2201895 RepID=A0A316KYB2_9FLAO|nr:hypothetical protein [Allomuricauda koreensis]PWL38088.1 hypothetical protein DKG77_07290 [Allomuricauda koreensis]